MTTRNFRVKNGLSVGDITISASGNTITGLATAAPSADGDVSNKKYVDDQDAAIASDTLTFTNKTFDANGTGNNITNIDIANMTAASVVLESEGIASNDNDTTLPTSAAVKDYVDTQLTGSDLDFQGDSGGALSIDLDSETLDIAGGTGIDTSGSGNTLTVAIDSTVTTASSTHTLTNKTIDANGTGNSISNIEVADFAGSAIINVSETLASNDSDTALVTAGAIIDYVDAQDANIAGDTLTFTNKTFDANGTGNSITNIDSGNLLSGFLKDEDNMASNSATSVASQQSIKAYVDTEIGAISSTTLTAGNTTAVVSDSGSDGAFTVTADGNTELVVNDTSATFSGNVVISGNLTTNGTTVTNSSTNTTIEDALIELGSGNTGSNANDLGLILERGSTGNNGFMGWDESEDKFIVGTTTGTGASTGNLTITTGTLVANIEGNVTGDVTGTADVATAVTVADESSDTSCNVIFTTAASGNLAPKSGTNLTFNSSNGTLTATTFSGSGASLTTLNGSNISSGTIAAARVATLNQNTTGSAATLTTARNIGGVSFNGSANINLPGVNTAGNQNTSGTAAIGTAVTVTANNTANETVYLTFVDGATGTQGIETDTGLTYNPSTNVLTTTASSARYADVAERFEADAPMEIGSVVEVGGSAEITEATSEMSEDVFGVISHKPAYMMNSGAGTDESHPFVAMTGRTPVRVTGVVNKGQRLVTSSIKGCARAVAQGESISPFNVIGRALETNTEAGIKLVNCAVRTNN